MSLTLVPRGRTAPGRGLCAITRPTRVERAVLTRPTAQRARRIRVRAVLSRRPISRGT